MRISSFNHCKQPGQAVWYGGSSWQLLFSEISYALKGMPRQFDSQKTTDENNRLSVASLPIQAGFDHTYLSFLCSLGCDSDHDRTPYGSLLSPKRNEWRTKRRKSPWQSTSSVMKYTAASEKSGPGPSILGHSVIAFACSYVGELKTVTQLGGRNPEIA